MSKENVVKPENVIAKAVEAVENIKKPADTVVVDKDIKKEVPPVEKKPEDKVVKEGQEAKEKPDLKAKAFKALRKKEMEILEKERSLAEKDKTLKDKETSLSRIEDPISFLINQGWTNEQISEFIISGKKPELKPKSDLEERLEKLEKEKKDLELKAENDLKESKINEEHKTHIYNIGEMLKTSPDTYELLINKYGDNSSQKILYFQAKYEESHGKEISPEEAALHIEQALEKIEIENYNKLSNLKKVKAKVGSQGAKPVDKLVKANDPKKSDTGSRTLNSTMTQTTKPSAALTERERLERAVQAVRNVTKNT